MARKGVTVRSVLALCVVKLSVQPQVYRTTSHPPFGCCPFFAAAETVVPLRAKRTLSLLPSRDPFRHLVDATCSVVVVGCRTESKRADPYIHTRTRAKRLADRRRMSICSVFETRCRPTCFFFPAQQCATSVVQRSPEKSTAVNLQGLVAQVLLSPYLGAHKHTPQRRCSYSVAV